MTILKRKILLKYFTDINFLAAHPDRAQWQGDGGQVPGRVDQGGDRQPRPYSQDLGPEEQAV